MTVDNATLSRYRLRFPTVDRQTTAILSRSVGLQLLRASHSVGPRNVLHERHQGRRSVGLHPRLGADAYPDQDHCCRKDEVEDKALRVGPSRTTRPSAYEDRDRPRRDRKHRFPFHVGADRHPTQQHPEHDGPETTSSTTAGRSDDAQRDARFADASPCGRLKLLTCSCCQLAGRPTHDTRLRRWRPTPLEEHDAT